MKLLMITRKIDRQDVSPASPTYDLAKKIGGGLEYLHVITWQKSNRGDLPENIKIVSLPNHFKIFALQWHLLKLLPKVDGVFCHQNPEYTILSFMAKVFRKKIVSWYTHKAVNFRRRLMELVADTILTASDKSFRKPLFPKKVIITGHGIDTGYFKPLEQEFIYDKKFRIISVGRISPTKDYETLIKAAKLLGSVELKIIGAPVLESDKKYFEKLKKLAGDNIKFVGGIPHNQTLSYYQNCDLFVNLSQTGSVDKVVLEAMACGRLVLTCNEAFEDILKDERLIFESKNYQVLAKKIKQIISLSQEEKQEIGKKLRNIVVENHNLNNLADKIISFYELSGN